MERGHKHRQKTTAERLRQVLNKDNPMDQLIFNLARTGKLDVGVVDFGLQTKNCSEQQYSRKSLRHSGKHSI